MQLLVMLSFGIVLIYLIYCKLAYKTIDFIFTPLIREQIEKGINITTITNEQEQISEKNEPLAVKIKDNKLETDKIIEYKGEEIKQFEFRPQTWEQFISQTNAKEQAQTIKKKARKGIRCHFLLSAIKGHGKTTFIELFAKDIGAKLIHRVGKQVDEDELLNIINEINTSEEKFVVFFLDEIDTTDWKVIKILNPIIEQFKINNKKIKPFIFACATINKHKLIKNNPDTLDRIPHQIQFTRYTTSDIATILTQYKQQLYPTENVSNEIIMTIAKSCKFNPRTSISFLEDYIVVKDINKVLQDRHIVKDGLTEIDMKILKILSQAKRPMGANALAMRVGIGEQQYLREYEPYLVEFDYIARIPSRIITEKGRQALIKEI